MINFSVSRPGSTSKPMRACEKKNKALIKNTNTHTHTCSPKNCLSPIEAILVIFGRRALIFFVWKLLEKYEKWHHFCAHAQCWSPWRRKNVEKGHLAPSNLTFLLIAIDTNGFRRMKEEG